MPKVVHRRAAKSLTSLKKNVATILGTLGAIMIILIMKGRIDMPWMVVVAKNPDSSRKNPPGQSISRSDSQAKPRDANEHLAGAPRVSVVVILHDHSQLAPGGSTSLATDGWMSRHSRLDFFVL